MSFSNRTSTSSLPSLGYVISDAITLVSFYALRAEIATGEKCFATQLFSAQKILCMNRPMSKVQTNISTERWKALLGYTRVVSLQGRYVQGVGKVLI